MYMYTDTYSHHGIPQRHEQSGLVWHEQSGLVNILYSTVAGLQTRPTLRDLLVSKETRPTSVKRDLVVSKET